MADEQSAAQNRGAVVFLAWWSVGWAAFLAAGVVVRNWGAWPWWPFWMMDYVASALLFAGAWFALRQRNASRLSPLVGAFGFSTAMGYVSFFSHLSSVDGPTNGPIPHVLLTAIIGVLFALAAATFAAGVVLSTRLER